MRWSRKACQNGPARCAVLLAPLDVSWSGEVKGESGQMRASRRVGCSHSSLSQFSVTQEPKPSNKDASDARLERRDGCFRHGVEDAVLVPSPPRGQERGGAADARVRRGGSPRAPLLAENGRGERGCWRRGRDETPPLLLRLSWLERRRKPSWGKKTSTKSTGQQQDDGT